MDDQIDVALTDCRCEVHGEYQAYRDRRGSPLVASLVDCPRCIDAQLAKNQQARTLEKRERDQRAWRGSKLREIWTMAGIPPRFQDRHFLNYRAVAAGQQLALAVCSGYAESWLEQYRKGGSLVLVGKPGTGKTHLACAIASAIIPEHLATVSVGTVASLLRTVRATYGGRGDESKALADLVRPDLLVIDEIGSQLGTDHELQLLFEIIDSRYKNLKPMILISNLNAEDLEKYLGHRVMDRMRECGSIVAFDWTSHRGQEQSS